MMLVGAGGATLFDELPDALWCQFLPVSVHAALTNLRGRPLACAATGALIFFTHTHLLFRAADIGGQSPAIVIMVACVDGIPRVSGADQRLVARIYERNGRALVLPVRVALTWYRNPQLLVPGQCLRLASRTRWPIASFTEGTSDYPRWLFSQGIVRQGYIKAELGREEGRGGAIHRLRLRLANGIERTMGIGQSGALVKALALGIRADISDTTREILVATGTAHLLAVSGLHIGLVCAAALLLGERLVGRWQRRIPVWRVGVFASLIAGVLYSALAGFSLPTQRAVAVVALCLIARWLMLPFSALRTLAIAGGGIFLLTPHVLVSSSAWMSFVAVGVIVFGLSQRQSGAAMALTVSTQGVLMIGMAPLVLALFDRLPLIAPVANIVAVPFTGVLIIPAALLGTVLASVWEPAGVVVLSVAGVGLDILLWGLGSMAELDLWLQPNTSFRPLGFAFACLGCILALMWAWAPGRWLAGLLIAPTLMFRPGVPGVGELRATVLAVGQGLSVVVETRSHLLVYDTGPKLGRHDAASLVIAPYLRSRGRNTINRLIVSHADSDHASGIDTLIKLTDVREFIGDVPNPPMLANPHATWRCPNSFRWQWDGVRFHLFRAPLERGSRNDLSCLLRVETGEQSLLIPGDIEALAERALLRSGQIRQADVLVAPHHGSATSSTRAFISAVAPHHVVIAAGRWNRYGFPAPAVVDRVRQAGATLWHTGEDGAVEVTMGGQQGTHLRAHSASRWRVWHHDSLRNSNVTLVRGTRPDSMSHFDQGSRPGGHR